VLVPLVSVLDVIAETVKGSTKNAKSREDSEVERNPDSVPEIVPFY
jgi:hypothetical protein